MLKLKLTTVIFVEEGHRTIHTDTTLLLCCIPFGSLNQCEEMDRRFKLDVWSGDWGLPSIDPHCLAVLIYCKFSGVPLDVNKTGNILRSPSGTLPVLRYNDVVCSNVTSIFNCLRKENWGIDFELTPKESADVVAFSCMLEEKLLPAVLHLWWVDDKNFIDVTRPSYAKVVPFPLNFFFPQRKQKKAELRISLTRGKEFNIDSETETRVYKDAKECLNLLSHKLGEKKYMFGNKPSSLDALVVGYLAPILKAPLPTNQLNTHLVQCDNLCRLCNSVLTSFFPHEIREMEERVKSEREKRKPGSGLDTDFPHKRRNMILGAIFALTVMIGYAFSCGLIEIRAIDDEPMDKPVLQSEQKEKQK